MGITQATDPKQAQKVTTKPKQNLDPALKKKLDAVEEKMPKRVTDFGTERDGAYQEVKKTYDALIEKHKPDIKAQMDLLHKAVNKGGSLDVAKYTAAMEEFKARTESEGVGILPEPLEKIRTLLKKAEADAKPDSVARKSLMALDKSSFQITFPALMRENYASVVRAIHEFENPAKKPEAKK